LVGFKRHACACELELHQMGMTKKAAVDDSKGEARVESGPNIVRAFNTQAPFATIPQKAIGGFTFQVTLCTEESNRVTSVALSPSECTNLPTLRSALVSQYEKPTTVNGTDIWNDRKAGNTRFIRGNWGRGRAYRIQENGQPACNDRGLRRKEGSLNGGL
jgi:hypothetical protein